MKRRNFLLSLGAAGTIPVASIAGKFQGGRSTGKDGEYFELIKFHLHVGKKKNMVSDFYRDAAIPALNRLGINPVGVFNVQYGPNDPSLYVLIPHKSLQSMMTVSERLLKDKQHLAAGERFLKAPLSDSAYVRMEKTLLKAFKNMPTVEIPTSLLHKKSRIYELRIYESHSQVAGKKKIQMFNEGGEIAIFRKTGLNPVFFAETIIGKQMPNLSYMLVFENMDSRYKHWEIFRKDPAWLKLRVDAQYKDTVSNVTDIILKPAAFSQI
jgi:hypothetical protein